MSFPIISGTKYRRVTNIEVNFKALPDIHSYISSI